MSKSKKPLAPAGPLAQPKNFGEYFEEKIKRDLKTRDFTYKGRPVSLARFKSDEKIQEVYFRNNTPTIRAAQTRYRLKGAPTTITDIEKIRNYTSFENSNRFQGQTTYDIDAEPQTHFKGMRSLDDYLEINKSAGVQAKEYIIRDGKKIIKRFTSPGQLRAYVYRSGKIDYEQALFISSKENFITPDATIYIDIKEPDEENDNDF